MTTVPSGGSPNSVGDPAPKAPKGTTEARLASNADQTSADADQTAANADQKVSGVDQGASDSDQAIAALDQRASDRDQRAADRQHAAAVDPTTADEADYEASRHERKTVSIARQANRIKRARTARDRDAAAGQRDRIGDARDERGSARDARAAAGGRAIDEWDRSRWADGEMSKELGAKYRGLLEAAPDAMVVVNQGGEIILFNVQAEKQFGYRRDELVGQQVTNIIPEGFAERLIADDLRSAEDALAQQIGTGIELTGRRKDGSEFPIEIMLSPLESAEGILVTAAIRNISVRKDAEAHLAQMEGRYRGLLEAAPDAMVVVNQDGEIVLLNVQAEKQFGYRRDELVGQPVVNIIPEGFAERLIADDLRSAAEALAQQIGTGIELSGLRKDGSEFPIEIMLSPLDSDEGILVTAAIRNISLRKQAEGQLLQAQKLESIGRLAGGIAHDFNNMLFAIHGYAELLAGDLASTNRSRLDPDRALMSVNAISQAADRATALTSQLLAFSRQQVISPKVLDLNAAIGGLEPMVRQLIGGNMRLVLKLAHDAGHIRADAGQLDQILVNLVVNARDAMPDGGTVTIETSNVLVDEPYAIEHFDVRPGPYVLLVVIDTGVGMDRLTREHIFEPFFSTKELGKGTGLGLATAYGIVRQAGGHIWLYSEPGVGTSFKLYFPRVDAVVTTEQPAVAAAPAVGAGTVLVVEDEPVVRDMTTQLLTRSGYEVIAVANGQEAMDRLAGLDTSIDVLVTDVIMPNMSGIELAEAIMDEYPQVGVVLLSGYTAETLNLERVTMRGAMFVPKPVTSTQLLVAIRQAKGLRQANPRPLPLTASPH